LDAAILDRCDESIFFPLPDDACRKKLLRVYYEKYVRSLEKNHMKNTCLWQRVFHRMIKDRNESFHPTIESNVMNENQLNSIVSMTAGFSGREIAKLMIGVQGGIYSSENATLTSDIVDTVVTSKVKDHKNKVLMSGRFTLAAGTEDVDLSFSSIELSENGSSQTVTATVIDSSLDKSLLLRAAGGVSMEELKSLTT
jgi:AAA+ superfamily predicted ATPase